jgi:hypothetical protein
MSVDHQHQLYLLQTSISDFDVSKWGSKSWGPRIQEIPRVGCGFGRLGQALLDLHCGVLQAKEERSKRRAIASGKCVIISLKTC